MTTAAMAAVRPIVLTSRTPAVRRYLAPERGLHPARRSTLAPRRKGCQRGTDAEFRGSDGHRKFVLFAAFGEGCGPEAAAGRDANGISPVLCGRSDARRRRLALDAAGRPRALAPRAADRRRDRARPARHPAQPAV